MKMWIAGLLILAAAAQALAEPVAGSTSQVLPLPEGVADGQLTVDNLVRTTAATCRCAPVTAAAPAAAATTPLLVVGSASGAPGKQVTFTVKLQAPGAVVAGTQNDLTFDSLSTPILADATGRPDCVASPTSHKSVFAAFQPPGCTGTGCTGMRALVLSLSDVNPIPDGVLYTCKVRIDAGASAGHYPVTSSGVIFSDPTGTKVPNATGTDGSITVVTKTSKACLVGNDPSVAGDPAQISAVRALVDAGCPCASFDGSPGNGHRRYLQCVRNIVAGEVAIPGHLRPQCARTVNRLSSQSTCGVNPVLQPVPCIQRSLMTGKVTCRIRATMKKDGVHPTQACTDRPAAYTRVACPSYTHCIDAADTNGDLLIGPGDAGVCVLPPPTPTSTTTPIPVDTPTPTATETPIG